MQAPSSPDPGSLDRLHDIVELAPVSIWPPAPGWYVVGLALLFACLALAWRGAANFRADRYRRAALAELALLRARVTTAGERDALGLVPELLKRCALAAYPRDEVASLSGGRWLEFLDRSTATSLFSEGGGRHLPGLSYDPTVARGLAASEVEALLDAVRHWFLHHDRGARPC